MRPVLPEIILFCSKTVFLQIDSELLRKSEPRMIVHNEFQLNYNLILLTIIRGLLCSKLLQLSLCAPENKLTNRTYVPSIMDLFELRLKNKRRTEVTTIYFVCKDKVLMNL